MNDETSQLLSDTAEKLFSDHVTKNCIIDAEKGTWPEELWSEVIENGLNLILVPEELGGVGGLSLKKKIQTIESTAPIMAWRSKLSIRCFLNEASCASV